MGARPLQPTTRSTIRELVNATSLEARPLQLTICSTSHELVNAASLEVWERDPFSGLRVVLVMN
jgi:hypothetical protein